MRPHFSVKAFQVSKPTSKKIWRISTASNMFALDQKLTMLGQKFAGQ